MRFWFRQYLIVYIKYPLSAGMNDSENQTDVYEWLQVLQELCGPFWRFVWPDNLIWTTCWNISLSTLSFAAFVYFDMTRFFFAYMST